HLPVEEDQVAGVLGGVAGRVHGPDGQPAAVDVLQVEGRRVPVGGAGGGGQHEFGAAAQGGLLGAGHVVVVQVGLQHEPRLHTALLGGAQEAVDVALGVDQDALPLVGQQVGLVAEAWGRERDDVHADPLPCKPHPRRASSSAVSSSDAAPAESRMDSGRLAPGIGMTTGLRASSQARQTCCGETPRASPISAKASRRSRALRMPPSGDQGRKARPSSAQTSISGSLERNRGEYWFCTLTRRSPRMAWAVLICSGFALEIPAIWILPASCRSFSAPMVSSYGTFGSGRWCW